jgi:acyl-CoA thioesterase-2
MTNVETLAEILALEPIELNLFRGVSPIGGLARIFGGQVIAQALIAAYQTVPERICHSLHCYFIRPGDPSVPILYEVDRSRDGSSFTTRRVTAIQHGRQIFNLAASFQIVEDGLDHQSPMPPTPTAEDMAPKDAGKTPTSLPFLSPMDVRRVDSWVAGPGDGPAVRLWVRARADLGPHQRIHQAAMAYASDMSLLGTAVRPHGLEIRAPGMQFASLDHALWFHRPTNFNEWHLYVQESPSASGARGFTRGQIFRHDGVLVASVAQEGLIRMREEDGATLSPPAAR